MENDLRYFEYPQKPSTKKLWAFISFTVLIFLNISAFQYCFSKFLSYVLCFSCWSFENNLPGSGVLARFSAPGVGVSHFLSARGVGIHLFKKFPRGLAGGWMVRLGID